MGAFIIRQPNGLLCRFSSIVDCPTNYNMTEDDYVELCASRAADEARRDGRRDLSLKRFYSIEDAELHFQPNNMSQKKFNKILKEMQEPVTPLTKTNIST